MSERYDGVKKKDHHVVILSLADGAAEWITIY